MCFDHFDDFSSSSGFNFGINGKNISEGILLLII